MWNADHNTMDTLINILGMITMGLGLVAFYLALTYERRFSPLRRKR